MNEIDDTYKQEEEDLDDQFIESHNVGRTKESTLKKYLDGIKKSRSKFRRDYVKHLRKEKWKIWHTKKKKEKRGKVKHLKIAHFKFGFNIFQKIITKLNIFFFDIKRIFSRTFVRIIPSLMMYVFYKIIRSSTSFFGDSVDFISKKKTRIISDSIKFFKNFSVKSKEKYANIIKKIKNLFPNAKDEKKDDKDDKKDDEKKDEKPAV